MPFNAKTQEGDNLNDLKRIAKVELQLVNTKGVYANKNTSPERKFSITLDKAAPLFTGLKEIRLLGYDKNAFIELTQKDPLPFTLTSIGYETA